MKKMTVVVFPNRQGPDLSIEKDAGNDVLILMAGKDCKKNWENLRAICDEALAMLKK